MPKLKKQQQPKKNVKYLSDIVEHPTHKQEGVKRDQLTEDQYYAAKRAVSILEGHKNDNFKEPVLCQLFFEGYEFLKKLLDKYERKEV